jgi:hypothetical protein
MYPFHPRCGETVLVQRRFAYRGIDLVVIPQPDGSIACISEWMTNEQAARFKLSIEPCFSLEILRSMRAEVDSLLAFLPSESTRERDAHETQSRDSRKPATGTIRSGQAERCAGAGHATGNAGGDAAHRDRHRARNREESDEQDHR